MIEEHWSSVLSKCRECNFLTDQNLPVILSCQWAQHAIFQSKFNCFCCYSYWELLLKRFLFQKCQNRHTYIYTASRRFSKKIWIEFQKLPFMLCCYNGHILVCKSHFISKLQIACMTEKPTSDLKSLQK